MKKNFFLLFSRLDLLLRPYQHVKSGVIIIESYVSAGLNMFNAVEVAAESGEMYPIRIHRKTEVVQGRLPKLVTRRSGPPVERYCWKTLPPSFQEEVKGKIKRKEPVEIRIELNQAYRA